MWVLLELPGSDMRDGSEEIESGGTESIGLIEFVGLATKSEFGFDDGIFFQIHDFKNLTQRFVIERLSCKISLEPTRGLGALSPSRHSLVPSRRIHECQECIPLVFQTTNAGSWQRTGSPDVAHLILPSRWSLSTTRSVSSLALGPTW